MVCVRFKLAAFGLAAALGLVLCPASQGTVYYVSPTGSDANSGTTTNLPWQTPAHASSQRYRGGDQLLFQGGATNSGTISFTSAGLSGNTATNPVVVSSYGGAPAVIINTNGDTFAASNCGGLVISNINFIGGYTTNNTTSCGIRLVADTPGTYSGITIDHVTAGGFGAVGVYLDSTTNSSSFSGVRITYVNACSNNLDGIETYAANNTWQVHSNIYVGYCNATDNQGLPGQQGNGIVLGSVINSLVEFCFASNNNTLGDGGVGIWSWYSKGVTIQNCESCYNHTSGATDGDGFDIDIGDQDCVVQYCYSHDNDAAGFPFYQAAYAGASSPVFSNNVVRYNISQNDGRKNSYGAITLWNGGGAPVTVGSGNAIYNNTVFISQAAGGTTSAITYQTGFSNVSFYNNIFITTNGVNLVTSSGNSANNTFLDNDYYTSGGAFAIDFNGTNYGSLAAWRGAGSERFNGTNVGFNLNPQLVDAGGGGTIGNATRLPTLLAYQSEPSSPMRKAGLNLAALFGFNAGSQDFYGDPVPNGLPDIGAYDGPEAPQFGSRLVATNGMFSLMITNAPGSTIILASTNLMTWQNVYTGLPPFTFTDSHASNYPNRFYRAALGP